MVDAIDGVECFPSDLCTLTIRPTGDLDIFAVLGGLYQRKSYCLPSFEPPALKVVLDPVSDEVVDTFVRDLSEVVSLVRAGRITRSALSQHT